MDDRRLTENKGYELYDDSEADQTACSRGSRICSYLSRHLYAYTIGSCLYFKNDTDRRASSEEIELKSMILRSQKNGSVDLEDSDKIDSEWRRKTAHKADCKMKKRIQYHFKDHIRRWKDGSRRRFPWKVILHLLLVVLVTTQVISCLRATKTNTEEFKFTNRLYLHTEFKAV